MSELAASSPRRDLLLDVPANRRIAWICLDRGKLSVDGYSLLLRKVDGDVEIPAGMFASILLEPGVAVTHEAIRLCAENDVMLVCIGEAGTRIYSVGHSRQFPKRIIKQASIYLSQMDRVEAARRLYELMFGEKAVPSFTIEKLRGIEGSKVKEIYKNLADKYELEWSGRSSNAELQKSISYATGCLYNLAEVAIRLLGYSPAIGVVHSGNERSFAYDLADTVKFNILMPGVFEWHANGVDGGYASIRGMCRDLFRERKVLDILIENAEKIIHGDVGGDLK
jgi:CRISPR-associated protein Cas1